MMGVLDRGAVLIGSQQFFFESGFSHGLPDWLRRWSAEPTQVGVHLVGLPCCVQQWEKQKGQHTWIKLLDHHPPRPPAGAVWKAAGVCVSPCSWWWPPAPGGRPGKPPVGEAVHMVVLPTPDRWPTDRKSFHLYVWLVENHHDLMTFLWNQFF